jgi:hypothetical protein
VDKWKGIEAKIQNDFPRERKSAEKRARELGLGPSSASQHSRAKGTASNGKEQEEERVAGQVEGLPTGVTLR